MAPTVAGAPCPPRGPAASGPAEPVPPLPCISFGLGERQRRGAEMLRRADGVVLAGGVWPLRSPRHILGDRRPGDRGRWTGLTSIIGRGSGSGLSSDRGDVIASIGATCAIRGK